MNKRGVIEEWGNLIVMIALSIVVIYIFFFTSSSDKEAATQAAAQADLRLQQENALLTYLNTPISGTDFIITNNQLYANAPGFKEIKEDAIKNGMTFADLFRLYVRGSNYYNLIYAATLTDSTFSKYEITLILKNEQKHLTETRCAAGETSSAYLQVENSDPLQITLRMCQ